MCVRVVAFRVEMERGVVSLIGCGNDVMMPPVTTFSAHPAIKTEGRSLNSPQLIPSSTFRADTYQHAVFWSSKVSSTNMF